MDIDLEGTRFFVRFEVYESPEREFGGVRYPQSWYWTGVVTVTAGDGRERRVLAVCHCGWSEFAIHERDPKKLIASPFLLPGKEQWYADLMGSHLIGLFQNHRGRDAPSFRLAPIDREILVQAGIAADANDQLHAPLIQA